MRIVCYHIIILFLFCGCHSKESLREEIISLYEQGKYWEEAEQADSAAYYYLQSYELAKELENDSLIGRIGNAFGNILYMQSFYNHSIFVYHEAYLYNRKLEDKTAASYSLRGIGKNYISNSLEDSILYSIRLDSTLIYFNKAKELIPEIKSRKEIYSIYNNLCVYYTTVKKYDEALTFNQKTIRFMNDSASIYRAYSCRGNIFYYLEQFDSSVYYCKQAAYSTNLYTQHAACHQLSKALSKIGSPDSAIYLKRTFEIHDLIEQQKKEEKIMQLFQKTTQDKLDNEKKLAIFCIIIILLVLFFIGFILYRKHNRCKLLKKEHVISLKEQELVKEQEQTHTLRKELEESKQITNYAELKEEKQEEEAKNISNIIQLGEECVVRFQKRSFYKNTKKRLNEGASFTKGEREVLYQKVSKCFNPYIKEVNKCIQLADEDYFVCCLTLLGFSTKYCAVCRGVGEAGIRVQRKRIKDKLKAFFHSDEFCNSIFDRKSSNSIH